MKVLIVRKDKLRIHQDYLYVMLYAKKHGIKAEIKTFNQLPYPSLVIDYLKHEAQNYDLILLDGELGCNQGQYFNQEMAEYLTGPDAVFIRQNIIIRSSTLSCIEKARELKLNAVADNESWRLTEYVYAHTIPLGLQCSNHADFGLMYSHV